MEGSLSVFMTMREVCIFIRLSRAQVDRLRRDGKFVDSFELTGAPNGKVGFLRCEILEWVANRRKRTLRPLADDSD